MKKRIVSLLTAFTMLVSICAVTFNAWAIIPLTLDMEAQETIDGADDLAWFSFTPQASGTYSFLSYNIPASEGYLFIREVDKVTNTKQYVQLAYSNSDENYIENGHNSRQFCLTYHLEAGVKYFFAAGWYLSGDRTTGTMKVKLRCDGYDSQIERIEASTVATLDSYNDGMWKSDANGERYFFYNISKIIANTTVTLFYLDGTTSKATGKEVIDGFTINYYHDQVNTHWYPQADEQYTSNKLTVQVLDKSTTIDVEILTAARFYTIGTVTDNDGEAIENAEIIYRGVAIAATDVGGKFYFYVPSGKYECVVAAENCVDRNVSITVSSTSENDFQATPITLCANDYNDDNIVNAKDFAVMNKIFSEQEIEEKRESFVRDINFSTSSYPPLSL